MAAVVSAQRKPFVPAILPAAGRFGRYKDESEKAARKADVKEDRVLRQLKTAWRSLRKREFINHEYYNELLTLVKDLRYSAADVEKFSLALAEFQDEGQFSKKAGLFLSALINNGNDTDYIIHTGHLKPILWLGYKNSKNITVEGNAGDFVGPRMEGGEIHINGEIGSFGDIKHGKIYHKGKLIVDK
jgi:hypothetical protein